MSCEPDGVRRGFCIVRSEVCGWFRAVVFVFGYVSLSSSGVRFAYDASTRLENE